MNTVFYISAIIAVATAFIAVTRASAVHALLNFVVSLLAVSVVFFTLGAPFAAAMEVIIYAGAIMVLFVFVMMMLNLGPQAAAQERLWLTRGAWIGAAVPCLVLLAELIYLLARPHGRFAAGEVGPQAVGAALFGPYLLAVELAGFVLLTGIVAAHHLGRRETRGSGFGVRGSGEGQSLSEEPHGDRAD